MQRNRTLPARGRLLRAARYAAATVQAVAFWAGVVMPLGAVSVLAMLDLGWGGSVSLLAKLLAAQALVFVVGHGHDPSGLADGARDGPT